MPDREAQEREHFTFILEERGVSKKNFSQRARAVPLLSQ
jgi:hypothetical protein